MRARYATKPREQISAILQREQRYLTAAQIYDLLRRGRMRASLSTVYRTLDLLTSTREASARVDERGETTYVSCALSHHHHAVCRQCGKVQDVPCEAVDSVSEALRRRHGFELDEHEMEFFGTCASCR